MGIANSTSRKRKEAHLGKIARTVSSRRQSGKSGGGDYSPIKKLIVFDVLVADKWWLSYENVCDVASKLSLDVVPSFGEMTLEEATEFVRKGFKSKCAINIAKDAEGLVGRPLETLFDKKGHRLITKLKTKDF